MPNPSRSGIRGDPWHNCHRCGLSYRISQLQWQTGLLLCTGGPNRCFDKQTTRQRDMQISRCLAEATLYPDAQVDPKLVSPTQATPDTE